MSSIFSLPMPTRNDLIGTSTALESARRRAFLASRSDLPVLLLGEPGVGKETFARLIAQESTQADRAFVKIEAKRLSSNDWDELLNLLIGEKTENTFRELVDGVLYLAEIERVPLETQRRFATAFQASKLAFRPLFGTSTPFLRLREKRVLDPNFEASLLGFPIFLPPLRERKMDFYELANAFFHETLKRLGAPPRELTELELQGLVEREYPQNLDDLRRTLEILAEMGTLPPKTSNNQLDVRTSAPFLTLDQTAKLHIEEALRRSKGVVEGSNGAAKALDINPYTLRARMRKLKIDWTKFRPDEET